MPRLHVCALSQVAAVARESRAAALLSLINPPLSVERPAGVAPQWHKLLEMHDIAAPLEGHILPSAAHVDALLAFARAWDRRAPMLIHCWAGVSRSTAAAFIAACALAPGWPEQDIARAIRDASPTATPNRLMVALADERLGRQGRMNAAVAAIGRGADCYEGVPFALDLPGA